MTTTTLDPTPGGGSTRPEKNPRGLFDAFLCGLLIYGVYAATPLGAVAETAIRAAAGDKERPSLFASFRGRDTEVTLENMKAGAFDADALHASLDPPQSVSDAAAATGINQELLLSLLALEGRCDAGRCELERPPFLDTLGEIDTSGSHVPIRTVADVLKKGALKFDGDVEAAVEALYIPPFVVERAVRQAKSSNISDATFIESHAEFYPAPTRRGVMQRAVHILALFRMRTLAWPTPKTARVTSPFGYRTHPVLKTRRFHNGTDIGVRTGTPLRSAHRGRVTRAGEDAVSGQYVHVSHGFGILSTYCHMSQVDVKRDQWVKRREVLGLSGMSGRVTGPHLHYIIRLDKKAVDPQAYGEAPARTRPLDMNGKDGGIRAPKALGGRFRPDDATAPTTATAPEGKKKRPRKKKGAAKDQAPAHKPRPPAAPAPPAAPKAPSPLDLIDAKTAPAEPAAPPTAPAPDKGDTPPPTAPPTPAAP